MEVDEVGDTEDMDRGTTANRVAAVKPPLSSRLVLDKSLTYLITLSSSLPPNIQGRGFYKISQGDTVGQQFVCMQRRFLHQYGG